MYEIWKFPSGNEYLVKNLEVVELWKISSPAEAVEVGHVFPFSFQEELKIIDVEIGKLLYL